MSQSLPQSSADRQVLYECPPPQTTAFSTSAHGETRHAMRNNEEETRLSLFAELNLRSNKYQAQKKEKVEQ